MYFFFFSSRRRHTRSDRDWSSDVCSSDLGLHHEGELVDLLRRQLVELELLEQVQDRKSTRLNSSHDQISYAVFCLKKKKKKRYVLTSPHVTQTENRERRLTGTVNDHTTTQ